MVIYSFVHVFFAVVDRIIYLSQTRQNLKFEYFYYDKLTGEKKTQEEYDNIDDPDKCSNFDKIYFQFEEENYPLKIKYALHLFIILFSHIFIFWYFPITGNINLQNSFFCELKDSSLCNEFSNNSYLIVFYLLYAFYMLFSALQIKFGMFDMRKKSLLMRGDNIVYFSAFNIHRAIPFLYELKLLIDWTVTATALDFFKWLKFESIYDKCFVTHCTIKGQNIKKKVGDKVGWFEKTYIGIFGFAAVLAIILGPLLLFSSLNPTNMLNNIESGEVKLSISFFNNNLSNNFTLFYTKQSPVIEIIGIIKN